MKLKIWVRFLMLCISTIMFGLLSGCGGGGGGDTTIENGSTVIPATTKVLDDSSSLKISSIAPDQSTVTFTGTNSQIDNLKLGDVLVLGVAPAAPEGMLKKVTGVQKNSNGTTTLLTGTATLEEAVQKASVSYSKEFTIDDVVSDVTLANGVSKAVPLSMNDNQISLLLNDVIIYDRDNDIQTMGDQITVNGKISFKPTVNMNIEIDSSTLKKFTFSVTGEESSELTIKAEVPAPALDKKKLLKSYNLGTQTFFIGYVPVVVTYELGIYVGVKGNISLGLSANANQKVTYTGGVKYADNNWSPINTNTTNFGFQFPTIDAAAEAKCYAGPELSTKIYGVAGPFINIYGYLLLQANPQSTPWWELFAGFEGNAGAKIEMLSGKITAKYNVNLFKIKKSLAQATTTPPATYSISGLVTSKDIGLVGVTVTLSGTGSDSTVTDENGAYVFANTENGTYTIAVVKTGYNFTPPNINNLTVNGADIVDQNFSANIAQSGDYSISGTIHSVNNTGPGLSGATVWIAGKTVITSSTGGFFIVGIPAGTYPFSVSKSGYDTFVNSAYYVGSNQTSLNFYLTIANSSLVCPGNVSASINGVQFNGPVHYQVSSLAANSLKWGAYFQNINYLRSGSYSGSLRARLWAVPYSYSGGKVNAYILGTFNPNFTGTGAYSSNQLYVGSTSTPQTTNSITEQTSPPPTGMYCIVATIEEYSPGTCPESDGYCYDQWIQFSGAMGFL